MENLPNLVSALSTAINIQLISLDEAKKLFNEVLERDYKLSVKEESKKLEVKK